MCLFVEMSDTAPKTLEPVKLMSGNRNKQETYRKGTRRTMHGIKHRLNPQHVTPIVMVQVDVWKNIRSFVNHELLYRGCTATKLCDVREFDREKQRARDLELRAEKRKKYCTHQFGHCPVRSRRARRTHQRELKG